LILEKKKQKTIYELCSVCIVRNKLVAERAQPYSYKEYARKAFSSEIRRMQMLAGANKINPYYVDNDTYGFENASEGTQIAVWIKESKI